MLLSRLELATLHGLIVLLSLFASVGARARAQDMPETLPPLPSGVVPPAGESSTETASEQATESAAEPPPPDAVRLEAQLTAALAFPFGGHEHGAAFGFAITYGAGWGSIPVMIGIDFMSVGRSNTWTSPAADDDPTTITRTAQDRLLNFDLWLRVQPPRWPVRPYAEGFVGAKLVQTHYVIAVRDDITTRGSDNEWTSAIGWGIGVDFIGLIDLGGAFSLTLGMRRLHGARVQLQRPTFSNGRGGARNRDVATNETIFLAGLCGRYDFGAAE
jgi:hypothetical protein